jgi:hypothetical protein
MYGYEDSGEPNEPVPLGVWIFWSIVGAILIIIWILSIRDGDKVLDFIVKFVSAAAGVLAGVAAYLAVRLARDTRREERFNRRPYFSYIKGEMGKYHDEEEDQYNDYIKIVAKQVGINPAADLTGTATIMMPLDTNDDFVPLVQIYRAVNDIAAGEEFQFAIYGFRLPSRGRHHYVVFDLVYFDAIYRTSFSQQIYLQWSGLYEDNDKASLYPITREAKPIVLGMLKEL